MVMRQGMSLWHGNAQAWMKQHMPQPILQTVHPEQLSQHLDCWRMQPSSASWQHAWR